MAKRWTEGWLCRDRKNAGGQLVFVPVCAKPKLACDGIWCASRFGDVKATWMEWPSDADFLVDYRLAGDLTLPAYGRKVRVLMEQ